MIEVFHFSTGLVAKEYHLPVGFHHEKHTHGYDHLSILAQGTVIVTTNGVKQEYTGPCCLEIKASEEHAVEALTDTVWYCIHATAGLE
jgi:quercetin dioxygenase-like cupin family protein